MADALEAASNQLQAMKKVVGQFKTAAAAAAPQADKLEKLKAQYQGLEVKVSRMVDQGAGRDWEPLKRDLKQTREEFSRLDRAVTSKQSAVAQTSSGAPSASAAADGSGSGGAGRMALGQAHAINMAPLDTEEALQRDKLTGITEIESQMGELKSMYKDFNTMVQDQQVGIDHVEQNVDKTTKHVERGVQELKATSEVQKSSRKWMCCLIVLAVVGVAVGIGIYFATKA